MLLQAYSYVQTPFSNPFPDTRKRMFKVTQGMSDPRLQSSPVEFIGMYPGVVRMSAVTWATGRVRRTTTWSDLKPETAKSTKSINNFKINGINHCIYYNDNKIGSLE